MKTGQRQFHQLHETLMSMIRKTHDIYSLIDFIMTTKISEGHDEIIATIEESWGHKLFFKSQVRKLKESLLEQKKTAVIDVKSQKARILMILIEKMIAHYQEYHSTNLDAEIFKLFEKAKKINFAQTDSELMSAIADL